MHSRKPMLKFTLATVKIDIFCAALNMALPPFSEELSEKIQYLSMMEFPHEHYNMTA